MWSFGSRQDKLGQKNNSQTPFIGCLSPSHCQGSITGAYSPLTKNVVPSFVLLAVQDTKVVCYVYELVNGEVAVSKTELNKKLPEAAVGANPALLESLLK
jgi:hypothetical protein